MTMSPGPRRLGRLLAGLAALFLLGCPPPEASDGLGPAPTGTLVVNIAGLPGGAAAAVSVQGPSGYLTTVTSSRSLTGLTPGAYTMTAGPVTFGGDHWMAEQESILATVSPGLSSTATISYSATTGSLVVTVVGLPPTVQSAVVLTGPGGFSALLLGSTTLNGLVPGPYQLSASPVLVAGDEYRPGTPIQAIEVVAGALPAQATVAHALATGRLAIALAGAPAGATPSVEVTGPGGFAQTVTESSTLTTLEAGAYTVTAADFSVGGFAWAPAPPVQVVQVSASPVPASASVLWSPTSGGLAIIQSGLPAGVSATLSVSGPGGFQQVVGGSTTLTNLMPGGYTLAAAPVSAGGLLWNPVPVSQGVTVVAGSIASAGVAWALQPGALMVTISGLPPGTPAAVTVTGPGDFESQVQGSGLLSGLSPGSYTVSALPVTVPGQIWNPAPGTQVVVVGSTQAAAVVSYGAATGSLALTIAGLPGPPADVTVTGPGGFSAVIGASQTLAGLVPGAYQVAASTVIQGGTSYSPSPSSQPVTVVAGATATASVHYSATTGSLTLTITGLPGGATAAVTATGPGGVQHQVSASQTLSGLVAGSWTVTAANVTSGADTYGPTPASQGVSITAGGSAAATVAYAILPASSLNLRIEAAYLTQAVQRPDHGVDLVAGRDAYLRVFAVANEANAAQPRVRVRLFHGVNEVQSWLLNAPSGSVTQVVNEGTLSTSWNVLVPGAQVVPGLRILAEVDPEGLIVEANEADNIFPAGGTPLSVTVRSLLPFQIRLIPVLQSVNGLQGDVSAGNAEGYLSELRTMMPIGAYAVDVRAVYTTNAGELQSGNANGAWGTVLSEVLALRNSVDASTRYYYGVVRTTYSSGIAGIGYVGSPASSFKAAIGWDRTGSRAGVLAHELGHNFGRSHAPCGGPGNPDSNYPHAGGQIGVWGLNVATLAVRAPTTFFDLMGYCNNDWISDYTWNAVVNFRAASPTGAPPADVMATGQDDGLLVWGRVSASGVVLEPTFRVAPTGAPLPTTGAWRIEGRDAGGALLVAQRFDPEEVADIPGGAEGHFAMVLPVGSAVADRLATIRVIGPGGTAELRAGPAPVPGADPVARMPGQGRRQLTWDATQYRMALVRDPASGEILSFARGGAINLWSNAATLDVQLSDGVRVVRRRVAVR